MNRLSFLKKFGIGAMAVVIAPHIFLPKKQKFIAGCDPITPNNIIIWDEEAMMSKKFDSITVRWKNNLEHIRKYPMTYAECYKMPDTYPELVRKYQHYYDEAWINLYNALEKQKKNAIKDLIIYGRTTIKMP